jgi:superfamily II DNA or RNA helicase
MKILRDYQEEAVKVSLSSNKGIICLPTGSGKTRIQSEILLKDSAKKKGHRVYLVLAPRIVLSYQLLKEYFTDFNNAKAKFWYAGLHSGGSVEIREFEEFRDGDIEFQDIIVTTSSNDIRIEIDKARDLDLPIVIFGTYHSAERASLAMNGGAFDCVICDEAHYLVSDQFEGLVKIDGINSRRTIFFTATMQTTTSDTGKGMNNVSRFGRVLLERIPRQMIDAGYMVRPRMHIIRFDRELCKTELVNNAGKIVSEAFSQHEYIARRTGKVFVTCTGTPMIQSILSSQDIRNLKRRRGVSVYAVASDPEIGNQIDGVRYNRQEFLRRLREDGKNISKEMIILHIDILTEGIDVPGITGILPFRSLRKSKFIQTLGRASRMSPDDLESFRDGEYTYKDLDKMMKPYSWIMIPDIEGEDTSQDIRELVRELRTYTFDPGEDIFISNEHGKMPPVILMDPQSEVDTRSPALREVLKELHHEFEEEIIARYMGEATLESVLDYFKQNNS